MSLPPNARDWMNRAELDYIGPFVKAWAAFNAWYRDASRQSRERDMLDYVKYQPNPVRREILPLLDNDNGTAGAVALKQAIYDLHQNLDAIRFEVMRNNNNVRISLRSVCINTRPLQLHEIERWQHTYKATRVQGGEIEITVTSVRSGTVRFWHRQRRYDAREIYESQDFTDKLSPAQRRALREFYDGCNPHPMRDLVRGNGPQLSIAGTQFRCKSEDLFYGLIETIYAMRNALLHGEAEPHTNVLKCYEPAYRIVMQFLTCVY